MVSNPFLQPFVNGAVASTAGPIPRVAGRLTHADHWGTVKARLGIGRMDYRVMPGLYAVGEPSAAAPVLVSANYKLSFDLLRAAVAELDAWILVLDTRGINVWCAAGKGTFGTDELVNRIELTGLSDVVAHRKLIVPQLGAPGVAGHRITKATRFKVVWGPINASDLPAFLAAGSRATPAMRDKAFPLKERCELIPLELVLTLKPLALIIAAILVLAAIGAVVNGGSLAAGLGGAGLTGVLAVLGGVLAGAVLTPLLLPWLPGRAFSLKGMWTGLLVTALIVAARGGLGAWPGRLEGAAWVLLATALASFLAMNFTGASTYTSLSGVRREMRLWLPLQLSAAVLGLGLWVAGALVIS